MISVIEKVEKHGSVQKLDINYQVQQDRDLPDEPSKRLSPLGNRRCFLILLHLASSSGNCAFHFQV